MPRSFDADEDCTSAGVPWSRVGHRGRETVEWMDGHQGPAKNQLPSLDAAPVPEELLALPRLHPDRPRGSKAMLDAAGAKHRLAGVRPGAWLVSLIAGSKWAKWPDGHVGWVPASTELLESLRVDCRDDMRSARVLLGARQGSVDEAYATTVGMSPNTTRMLSRELMARVREEFQLDWRGIHGVPHWARVRFNGLRLARATGGDPRVVELFAFLHDVRREHDGHDREHGARAASLAHELEGRFFQLDRRQMRLLEIACRDHSDGHTRADPTVQTCWDADRLDLGRVGTRPEPEYLCTEVARKADVIEDAYRRSIVRRSW